MVATLQSFLAWAMSEDEEEQESISMIYSNDSDNATDDAVELVSSSSTSNKLSCSAFACCLISSCWELAGCVTAVFFWQRVCIIIIISFTFYKLFQSMGYNLIYFQWFLVILMNYEMTCSKMENRRFLIVLFKELLFLPPTGN